MSKPNTTCDTCGEPIYRRPSVLRKNKGKYCSIGCRNKANPMMGEKNPAWNGGVTFMEGRKLVRCPEEFKEMARQNGYVLESRLIMAKKLGRPLLPTEIVHHEGGDVTDDREEKLMLFENQSKHKAYEHLMEDLEE